MNTWGITHTYYKCTQLNRLKKITMHAKLHALNYKASFVKKT